jgi:Putative peptidoglycan binding domain
MGRSSWPVHFRNAVLPSGNWYCGSAPVPLGISFFSEALAMSSGVRVRVLRFGTICALVLVCALANVAKAHGDASNSGSKPASSSSANSKTHKSSAKRRKKAKPRGQLKIDSERAQEIQEALIREHYLKGEATGKWDAATETALQRFQADNGWQSKLVPDSRALIKLGLGPSKDHLLNPESAMTTVPDPPKAEPVSPASHSAAPGADSPAPSTPPTTPASNTSSGPQ